MKFVVAARVAARTALICGALTAAYYLTAFIYDRAGARPPGPVVLIINTAVGATLLALAIVATGHLLGRNSNNLLSPILDALERIGAGDFSTRLNQENHNGVGGLVKSVNRVAIQLDQWEKLRQQFVSDVSHEIQSPLTSIRGFACTLKRDDLSPADRRRYLEIIETESQRLSRLATSLLDLTSLDAAQYQFDPQPFRLDSQIKNVILNCEAQWSGKQIEMDASLEEATIIGDEGLLRRLWINLIQNSINFTPGGGEIRVALCPGRSHHRVTVTDTGIGIDPPDLVRIFERFYRADRARTGSHGGNGLGLAIAKRVVEIHGGTIIAQSFPGKGSTFIVELPAEAPVRRPTCTPEPESPAPRVRNPTAPRNAASSKPETSASPDSLPPARDSHDKTC